MAKDPQEISHIPHHSMIVPEFGPFLEIRTTLNSSLPYALHFHPSLSIGLLLKGHTAFTIGDQEYTAQKGDIVLIPSRQPHSCNPVNEKPRSYHMAQIEPKWLLNFFSEKLFGSTSLDISRPVIRDQEFFILLESLFNRVLLEKKDVSEELGKILVRMQKRHSCFSPQSSSTMGNSFPLIDGKLKNASLTGTPTVSALAASIGLRRESFARSFRKKAGLTPSSYLHCSRLELGRHMLRQRKSIAEVAAACGYADQSHFHRMFLKFFSLTPGCYRKNRSHSYKK